MTTRGSAFVLLIAALVIVAGGFVLGSLAKDDAPATREQRAAEPLPAGAGPRLIAIGAEATVPGLKRERDRSSGASSPSDTPSSPSEDSPPTTPADDAPVAPAGGGGGGGAPQAPSGGGSGGGGGGGSGGGSAPATPPDIDDTGR